MHDLSIVIVSYNTRELLEECLDSVEMTRQDLALEVFVVDNASRDDSCAMVASKFPHVKLIGNDHNAGFAAANNQALEQAEGRHVMLLNSDTVVRPGALATLVRFMDDHPEVGYCGPKLVNGDGSHQPSARRFLTLWTGWYLTTGRAVRYPDSPHAPDLHVSRGCDHTFPADWMTGAALVVRRSAMEQVGLLDAGFFMYFEEMEWCQRLARANWQGWYVAEAEILHWGGQSVGEQQADEPFSGNHPGYWVHSRRRYERKAHGWLGMLICEGMDIGLHAAIWLRHRGSSNAESQRKARRAAKRIRYLLA